MNTPPERKAYPSDVSDEEWAFVAPWHVLAFSIVLLRRFITLMAEVESA